MTGMLARLNQSARKLRGDSSGVGAVEFALIAPVLIVLYMGALEISVAMSVNKKLARASSTVADLVTQEEDVNKATLKSMVNVAESVMMPFRTDGMKVKITGIAVDSTGVGKANWSWQQDETRPYSVGSIQSLPKELAVPNTFLVRTEVELDYELLLVLSGIQDVDFKTLEMKKTYHLRQRVGEKVTCSNC
ncbi:pilus assembly protein [Hoeflea sp. YIM 152468]|uniref:TadE/TadG family type IV pilus assembly protein n=1 Tax=Hoeflea sp. YIM 152468 TaxID=3031759 RepID=UPI0023DA5F16|nr:TadE/TadG family type IV pilus assembly protein [Hoeflea sp. YIM 152468]MDF1610366.1 pilus assembly protein [Hoeflea sp. YIM 152468]